MDPRFTFARSMRSAGAWSKWSCNLDLRVARFVTGRSKKSGTSWAARARCGCVRLTERSIPYDTSSLARPSRSRPAGRFNFARPGVSPCAFCVTHHRPGQVRRRRSRSVREASARRLFRVQGPRAGRRRHRLEFETVTSGIAQPVEQAAVNRKVQGSNPCPGAKSDTGAKSDSDRRSTPLGYWVPMVCCKADLASSG